MRQRGASLVELLIVLGISVTMAALTLPSTRTAVNTFQLSSAVTAAASAIQSTRYQAIMRGYPFAITFSAANKNYQVSSKPIGAVSFSNVGSAILLSPNQPITLSATTTYQFNPNGTVVVTSGNASFNISASSGTKTITVSGVGNVSVTP